MESGARGIGTPLATVIAAVCGVLGAVAGAVVKGYYDQASQVTVEETRVGGALELERLKFQADLILQAIDTDDQQTAVKTLKFFANAGLIPAYETKVLALTEEDEGSAVPALRPPPSAYRPVAELGETSDAARFGRAVGLFMAGESGICTAFLVEGHRAIVPTFCLPEDRDVAQLRLRLGYDSDHATVQDLEIAGIEEADAAGLAVLRLAGDADTQLQTLSLNDRQPVPGEAVYMVHHPLAGPKQLSDDCYLDPEHPLVDDAAEFSFSETDNVQMLRFTCRSEGGSAGAPVIAARDGALLGVHVAGRQGSFDLYAIPISQLLRVSSTLP